MSKTSDVAIVGGGIMGLAAAVALAERGADVHLFEQDRLAGLNGGSHGRARIIRLTYGRVEYVRLAMQAFRAWHALSQVTGHKLTHQTGSLDLCLPTDGNLSGYCQALTEANVPFDLLDEREIVGRFPQIALPVGSHGLYQSQSAILNADLCVKALAERAGTLGVTLHIGKAVTALEPLGPNIVLHSTGQDHTAGSVVLAAGKAMQKMALGLGTNLRLTISREQVSFFEPIRPTLHCSDRMPLLIFHLGSGTLSSVFPTHRDTAVKIMIENNGRQDLSQNDLHFVKIDEIRRLILPYLPNLSDRVLETDSCHYVLTEDGNFVVDQGRHRSSPPEQSHAKCVQSFRYSLILRKVLGQ